MYFHYAAMMWSSQQLCHQNEIFLGKKNPFMFLACGFQAELTGVVCNTSMFDYQKARLKIIPLFPTTSYLFIPVRATKDFQRVCIYVVNFGIYFFYLTLFWLPDWDALHELECG